MEQPKTRRTFSLPEWLVPAAIILVVFIIGTMVMDWMAETGKSGYNWIVVTVVVGVIVTCGIVVTRIRTRRLRQQQEEVKNNDILPE